MKTWKILDSENRVLTFTENDLVYTLFMINEDGENITILKAVDNNNVITAAIRAIIAKVSESFI